MATDNDDLGKETLKAALRAARKGQFSPEMQEAVSGATKGMSRSQRRTSLPEAELRRVVADIADVSLHVKKLHPGLEMASKDFENLSKKMQALTQVRTMLKASGAQMPRSASLALQASQFKFAKYADSQRAMNVQRENAALRADVAAQNARENEPEPGDKPEGRGGKFGFHDFVTKGARHSSILKTMGLNNIVGGGLKALGKGGALEGLMGGIGGAAAALISVPLMIEKAVSTSMDMQKNVSSKYGVYGDYVSDIAKTARFGGQPTTFDLRAMGGIHKAAVESYLPGMRNPSEVEKLIANSGIPIAGAAQGYSLGTTINQAKQSGLGLGGMEDSDYTSMLKPLLRYTGASLGQGNAYATPAFQAMQKAFGGAMAESGHLMFDKSETAKAMEDSLETLAAHGVTSAGLPAGVYSRMASLHGSLPGLGNPHQAASMVESLANAGENILDNPALMTMTAMYVKRHGGLAAMAKKDKKLRGILATINNQAGRGGASENMQMLGAAQLGGLNRYFVAVIQEALGKGQYTAQAIKYILGTTLQNAMGVNTKTGALPTGGGSGVDDKINTVKRMIREVNHPKSLKDKQQLYQDVASMGLTMSPDNMMQVKSLLTKNKSSKDYNTLADTMASWAHPGNLQRVTGEPVTPELNAYIAQIGANSRMDLQASENWMNATTKFITAVSNMNNLILRVTGRAIPQALGPGGK